MNMPPGGGGGGGGGEEGGVGHRMDVFVRRRIRDNLHFGIIGRRLKPPPPPSPQTIGTVSSKITHLGSFSSFQQQQKLQTAENPTLYEIAGVQQSYIRHCVYY